MHQSGVLMRKDALATSHPTGLPSALLAQGYQLRAKARCILVMMVSLSSSPAKWMRKSPGR